MLKTYDQKCKVCDWASEIWGQPFVNPPCPECNGETERNWYRMNVIGDDIPGGQWIENLGPTPVKVYSKSELRHKADERGLVSHVKHVGAPGSDKSPITTKWT